MPRSRCIELPGSTLGALFDEKDAVVLRLDPAVVHQYEEQAGLDSGTRYLQGVDLRISAPAPRLVIERFPCTIVTGKLVIGDMHHPRLIPLPMIYGGTTELCCSTEYGENLVIRGKGVVLVFRGAREVPE